MAPTTETRSESNPTMVAEPFPISHVADRYFIFDPDTAMHVRRNHNICGVLIGTIPNLSQQNVFLGIPLQLMPEEARVLVENGAAYIVDDVKQHREGFMDMGREERLKWLQECDRQGLERARAVEKQKEVRKVEVLKEKGLERKIREKQLAEVVAVEGSGGAGDAEALFDSRPASPAPSSIIPNSNLQPHYITPTTSSPPLSVPAPDSSVPLPAVPRQYPLFRYLHSRGYFQMPGIRFGCHYSVYPGDTLRFHSHFLATGLDWDEEFHLLDIVGGGRLGTGVKKAYLIGGAQPAEKLFKSEEGSNVRAFSIEWAGL